METIVYTKKSLEEFIQSKNYEQLINVPISKNRALSQIQNPRANEDDVLLVALFDGNKTVGYLGALPDYIFHNGQKEKFAWLSCFWVDEAYKSQNVSANLFLRVIRAWDKKICITNIVPWLEPIYQKTKLFQPTQYKEGFRGYFRFNLSEILPPKSSFFKNIRPLLQLSDWFMNLFLDKRLWLFKGYSLNDSKFEYLPTFEKMSADFIDEHSNSWPQRDIQALNWILTQPWILGGAKKDANSQRYFFSTLNKQFINQVIKFTGNKGELQGYLFLSIRDNQLSVPYVFFREEQIDIAARFLINKMIELKLNMVSIYHNALVRAIKKRKSPFIFSKSIKKPYFITKKFDFIDHLHFQDGDGDCAFY